MLSDAAGALGSPTVLAVPTLSTSPGSSFVWVNSASGDATGDGIDDLVLVSEFGRGFVLLEGGQNGLAANRPATPIVAQPEVPSILSLPAASRVRLADLNGDGADEILLSARSSGPVIQQFNIAATSPGGMIEVWKQTDSGTLERQTRVYAGPRPLDFTAARFNSEERINLLTLADFRDNVGLLSNLKPGGILNSALAGEPLRFRSPKPLNGYSAHRAMTFADTNRDGRPELLADRRNLDIIRLERREDSTFLDDDTLANPTVIVAVEPIHHVPMAPFSAGTMLHFRRQNKTFDQILTVGPAYGQMGGVSALIFEDPEIEPFVFRPGPAEDAAFVDVTGVGGSDEIILLRRNGASTALRISGAFSAATSPAIIPLNTSPIGSENNARLATCDIDGDWLRDIIVIDSQRAFVVRSLGGGLFAEPVALETGPARNLQSLDCADLNNDGFPEIIVGGFSQNPIDSLFGSSVMVYMNDGAGAFSTPIAVQARQIIRDLKAHDIDGDGARDLVLGTDDGYIDILTGDGLGGFTAANSININNIVYRIQIADFTEDGRPDIAALGALRFSPSGFGGSFDSLEAIYLLESTPATAKRGDINADGVIDGKDLVMILNTWGACAIGPCPGDVNGDGVVDGIDLLIMLSLWD